jgi:hypothetical protein
MGKITRRTTHLQTPLSHRKSSMQRMSNEISAHASNMIASTLMLLAMMDSADVEGLNDVPNGQMHRQKNN